MNIALPAATGTVMAAAADVGQNVPPWVYLVAAIIGSGVVQAWWNRRKTNAEGESVQAQTALALTQGVRQDMDSIRIELTEARRDLMAARDDAATERARTAEAMVHVASLEAKLARAEVEHTRNRHDLKNEITGLQGRVTALEHENESLRARTGLVERRRRDD